VRVADRRFSFASMRACSRPVRSGSALSPAFTASGQPGRRGRWRTALPSPTRSQGDHRNRPLGLHLPRGRRFAGRCGGPGQRTPARRPAVARVGAAGVVAVLTLRGAIGMTGRTTCSRRERDTPVGIPASSCLWTNRSSAGDASAGSGCRTGSASSSRRGLFVAGARVPWSGTSSGRSRLWCGPRARHDAAAAPKALAVGPAGVDRSLAFG
jgi:hypothetical protein